MISLPELQSTQCAICHTSDHATELYPETLDVTAFNSEVFSARRLPDRIHYRIVRCDTCGLVRSDPVADFATISKLYTQSTFDYGSELDGLSKTYTRYLRLLERFSVCKGKLLEIGSGNGFFLEAALSEGYDSVTGVEPSEHAIEQSSPNVRENLICDVMRPGLFEADTFDVICLFQVFDHLPDPNGLLQEAYRILKPNGMLLCLNHNVESLSARIMRERSPIIDIEHTYLYSPNTMQQIAVRNGLAVLHIGSAMNTYSLHYLMRLVPLPTSLKQNLLNLLRNSSLGLMQLSVPLGNLVMIAQKPAKHSE